MIFDWIGNSERMLATGRLSASDDWERRRVWTQEVAMLRHMMFGMGSTAEERAGVWLSLRGGTAESFAYDPVEVLRKFVQQEEQAASAGPLAPLPEVEVTDAEVAYLDSLEAPLPVRRYWARLLVYVKTMRAMSRHPVHDDRLNAFLARDAGFDSRPDHAAASVRRWSLACGIPFPEAVVRSGRSVAAAYAPKWIGNGSPVGRFRMGEFAGLDGLLAKGTFRCPRCGASFDRSPKAKTDLCPACQEHKRRLDKTEFARKSKNPD